MEALSQTNKRSLKPKHITWCALSVVFAGLLQVFGVVRVGKWVHAEHTSGAGELQAEALRMGEAMCKLRFCLLPPLLKNSSYLGEIQDNLGSDHAAFCHSFN